MRIIMLVLDIAHIIERGELTSGALLSYIELLKVL